MHDCLVVMLNRGHSHTSTGDMQISETKSDPDQALVKRANPQIKKTEFLRDETGPKTKISSRT